MDQIKDYTIRETVTDEKTAKHMGSGNLDVYATPAMIALMEGAAAKCIAPMIGKDKTSVGISIDIKHISATPLGDEVTATATLQETDGKIYTFEVEASDTTGIIGKGTHKRAVVSVERFMEKTNSKISTEK